ncbi:MAG TPA: hypothetical protein VK901_22585 [Nitrospiraceae bacterium]|nr:hypothetical protein [Nitrospiraceae bacterium]
MILFIGTLFRLLHIATIQVNIIRTISAMTGYIESLFGIGQLVASLRE